VELFGTKGSVQARFAVDTGATITVINKKLLEAIGYDLRKVTVEIAMITGSGVEPVIELNI